MGNRTCLVVIGLIVLLVMQGVALLSREERRLWHVWPSVLTLVFAAEVALAAYLLSGGSVVIRHELGVALFDGSHRVAFGIFLPLYAVGGALLVEAARAARQRPLHPIRLITAAVVLGLLSTASIRHLDSNGEAALQVYGYDLFTPTLILWQGWCLLEWALVLLDVEDAGLRLLLGALLVLGGSTIGTRHPIEKYAFDGTHLYWNISLILSLPLAFGLGLHKIAKRLLGDYFTRHTWARRTFRVVNVIVALISTALLSRLVDANTRVGSTVSGAIAALLFIYVLRRAVISLRAKVACTGATEATGAAPTGSRRKIIGWVMTASVAAIVFFTLDVTYVGGLSLGVDMVGLGVSVIVLVELLSEGPLLDIAPSLGTSILGERSFVRRGFRRASIAVVAVFSIILRPLGRLWTFKSLSGIVAKVLVIFVVLSVVQAFPNRHKTIVRPFAISGTADEEKGLGKDVAERAVHRIGILASELKGEILLSDRHLRAPDMAVVTDGADGVRAAVQNDSIEIASVKIPLGLLVDPIQRALELMFGMRVVTGTIQKSAGGYEVLASASTGETWQFQAKEDAAASAAGAVGPGHGVAVLGDRLAFAIVSSDPAWKRAGMTTVAAAFDEYSDGVEAWRRCERLSPDSVEVDDERTLAIKKLRAAVAADPRFALAHYRLGLALETDFEPAAAVSALQAAIDVNPHFGAAQNATARLLVDYERFLPRNAVDPPQQPDAVRHYRRHRAQHIWEHLVAAPDQFPSSYDRGSAYLGLCELLFTKNDVRRQAIYYCLQAQGLYEAIIPGAIPPAELLRTRATLSYMIGVLQTDNRFGPPERDTDWDCDARAAVVENGTLRWHGLNGTQDKSAIEYFQRAHELMPEDPDFSCELARIEAAAGDTGRLEELRKSVAMQMRIGETLRERAKATQNQDDADVLFGAAFNAFDQAIELDPEDLDALNSYAYTYRTWRLIQPALSEHERLTGQIGSRAEYFARKAARLSVARRGPVGVALIKSTLGEILLARGRPHEAAQVISEIEIPKHTLYDEIRWDLAQAYLCAVQDDVEDAHNGSGGSSGSNGSKTTDRRSGNQSRPARCSGLKGKAAALLAEIRGNEAAREVRPFDTARFSALPPCVSRGEKASPQDDLAFKAVETLSARASRNDCAPAAVQIDVKGAPGAEVHFWGRGGLDRWVDPQPPNNIVELEGAPEATHHQFFAQLTEGRTAKGEHGRRLSAVFSIETPAGTSTGCAQKTVKVLFSRPRSSGATLAVR